MQFDIELIDYAYRLTSNFTAENISTSFLTACMVVYIKSDDLIAILHVSPTQAQKKVSISDPYMHLKDKFKGKNIDAVVVGHTQNFSEKIFRESIEKYGVSSIKSLTIHANSSDTEIFDINFNLKNNTAEIHAYRLDHKHTLNLNNASSEDKVLSPSNQSPPKFFRS